MVQFTESGGSYAFHYDHRGTVFDVTDASQTVAQSYEHDAWGVRVASEGNLENPLQYQACAWLRSADLAHVYHTVTRDYDEHTGRFLQRGRAVRQYPFALSSPPNGVSQNGVDDAGASSNSYKAQYADEPACAKWMERMLSDEVERYEHDYEGVWGPGSAKLASKQQRTEWEKRAAKAVALWRAEEKLCGVEITRALKKAVEKVKQQFRAWELCEQIRRCRGLISRRLRLLKPPTAPIAWDIHELLYYDEGLNPHYSPRKWTCARFA